MGDNPLIGWELRRLVTLIEKTTLHSQPALARHLVGVLAPACLVW